MLTFIREFQFKTISAAFLAAFLAAFVTNAQAHDGEEEIDPRPCQALMTRLSSSRNVDQMFECMDFFWHHGGFENPEGSFNNTIALGRRILQLDPSQLELYSDVAWLLWSKYATWVKNPADMPDGADKAAQAVELLTQGGRTSAMARNPQYFLNAGTTLWPLAKHYLPEHYEFVAQNFKKAISLTTDAKIQVRARLNLGHVAREQKDIELAKTWYRSVLQIEPENAVALRYLKQLEEGAQP